MLIDLFGKDNLLISKANVLINHSPSGVSAYEKYEEFCTSLEMNPDDGVSFSSGDDVIYTIDSGVFQNFKIPMNSYITYSSEGGLSIYNVKPSSTSRASVSIPNVSRMHTTSSKPIILFTFHAPSDLRNFDTKINKNGNGCVIYAGHRYYNSTSYRYYLAIRIRPNEITFYFKYDNYRTIPFYINTFEENGTTASTVYNQYKVCDIFEENNTDTEINLRFDTVFNFRGSCIFKPIKIDGINSFGSGYLDCVKSIPEGTDIKVYYGISDNDIEIPEFKGTDNSFNLLGIKKGNDLTGKYIWLKIEMETLDSLYTPSIINPVLKLVNYEGNKKLLLKLNPLTRMKNPKEKISVKYEKLNGTLHGLDNALESFDFDFTPEDLEKIPNPYIREKIAALNNTRCDFIRIYYKYRYLDEKITCTPNLSVDFINIGEINP